MLGETITPSARDSDDLARRCDDSAHHDGPRYYAIRHADRPLRDRLGRAVGQALGRNPFAIIVPCHRVLAAGGRVGGFSANGGITTKLRLLAIEGARTDPERDLFD